ncbi:aspartyl-phosphate phosphatase Spo0E family protein [Fictibacillus nanhaiensis]|uniref:aspartyl-phosphate phosphatase Spo0E family protein n=1 Tax=Fictibacillus nanhaiensis TaxID=742169 RepID=UPI002E217CBD|nr:aspartyl-phosphate phosphatase Spo0E family protein [Fictibacillus nanhaiensis]
MKQITIQEKIYKLREELYFVSNQLNYDLTNPILVSISQQLDQLLNQYARIKQEI